MINLLKAKSEFRKKGVTLTADKHKDGGGGSWRFAGEDNFLKTIQEPLSECGLEIIVTMNYLESLSVDTVCATLYHIESGENISSIISLPVVTPRKDKNGNEMYLDAEIERGKQFGYWSRILAIRLLGLSDIDPEDIKNRPIDLLSKEDDRNEEIEKINDFVSKLTTKKDETIAWILKTGKVTKIEDLSFTSAKSINRFIESKKNANIKSETE